MTDSDLETRILEKLEEIGPTLFSDLLSRVDEDREAVKNAVSELLDDNLIVRSEAKDNLLKAQSPVPISTLAYRGNLTPTQAIILYLYEEEGMGQTEIANILDYSPGNIQTNLERIEEKMG